jgi:RNA polymerase sigma-70 factor (ECF subfamily)
MDRSDEELLLEYAQGRHEAFDELAQRHLKGVYSFVLRFVGDTHEAEDVAQETFVKAWRALARYDAAKSSFKTWMLRIARNTAIDHLRKKRHIPFSEIEKDNENLLSETVADTGELPDELLAKADDSRALARALAELSPKHRDILLLYYTNDLTFDEVGELLGEPQNTVKSRHRRALVALREALARAPK